MTHMLAQNNLFFLSAKVINAFFIGHLTGLPFLTDISSGSRWPVGSTCLLSLARSCMHCCSWLCRSCYFLTKSTAVTWSYQKRTSSYAVSLLLPGPPHRWLLLLILPKIFWCLPRRVHPLTWNGHQKSRNGPRQILKAGC